LVTGQTVAAIKKVSRAADRIARGDFDQPLPVKTRDDVGQSMQSSNTMMAQLSERIQFAEIDPSFKTLHWVRAGHDPAFLYDPTTDAIEELKVERLNPFISVLLSRHGTRLH
jgi:hypothetical protein